MSHEICHDRQSVIYIEETKIAGHNVRIEIKSDAYDFQSYAIAMVWNKTNLKWNEAASVHYSKMQTRHALIYKRDPAAPNDFAADRDTLYKRLEELLK